MVLNVDNEGAKDLCDNWSVGGRTRQVEVKQMFLRELKESKMIDTNWIPGEEMTILHQEFARSVIREARSQICCRRAIHENT
jgi:hypothetical protein